MSSSGTSGAAVDASSPHAASAPSISAPLPKKKKPRKEPGPEPEAEEELQPLSFQEQEALSEATNLLPESLLPVAMQIIRESDLVDDDDDGVSIDLDQLEIPIQRKFQSFVMENVKTTRNKNKQTTREKKKQTKAPSLKNEEKMSSTPSLFSSLPEASWQLIASFATPPDAYNLALSSKNFFRSIALHDEETDEETMENTNEEDLLATRLLRASLLSSLRRVLEHSKSGITLDSALALADLPEGSAVIAGSTMAQACLGVTWGEVRVMGRYERTPDIDIFCSAKAAPQVRSWLVEHACMFVGFNNYCIDVLDERLSYTVDTKIHHVETWGSAIQNVNKKIDREHGWSSDEDDEKHVTDPSKLKENQYYQEVCEWGKDCQANYVDWNWNHGMHFDILGVDQNKNGAYDIKPERGELPFDFDGDGRIDLVVARADGKMIRDRIQKSIKEPITPYDLLDDFDLTICKASFDGKKFHIPNPHQTFSRKSTMEPNRRAVVESYVKHFKRPEDWMSTMDQSRLASSVVDKVRRDVPHAPFYRLLHLAAMLPPPRTEFESFDPNFQVKFGAPTQFHNWTCKLIKRLRKYQLRGIEVIDAPNIEEDFRIEEIDFMAFM